MLPKFRTSAHTPHSISVLLLSKFPFTMFPPQQGITLDIEALSGICGSISIACWVVVFSPQIIENFRRGSAEGLSVMFLLIWLAGDLANILGAILQGVLPTMIILAIYYTLADIVLLAQVFYYRGFTFSDSPPQHHAESGVITNGETEPLLANSNGSTLVPNLSSTVTTSQHHDRRHSSTDLSHHDSHSHHHHHHHHQHHHISAAHLSPATPLLDAPETSPTRTSIETLKPTTALQTFFFNTFAILLVCASGVFGWWIAQQRHRHQHQHRRDPSSPDRDREPPLTFDPLGQTFGYICAALYLGSRIPQLLLNHRRRSTEGVSLLFFLFACLGNLTYDMSIFAYEPVCGGPREGGGGEKCSPPQWNQLYLRYIAVNASWILGSFGTLLLDVGIFVQFFLYRKED